MPPQQLVELGAIALGETRRLRDVALGDLEKLGQVLALEATPRILERGKLSLLVLDRLLRQRDRDNRGGGERD